MATSKINLSSSQYVRINNRYGQLIIESLTGDIHIVLAEYEPAATNNAFHKLTDRQRLIFDKLDTNVNVWALGKNSGAQAVVTEFDVKTGMIGANDLGVDAWGRQKFVEDYSLFHGIWTFDVPNRIWEEFDITAGTWTPLASVGTNVTSVDGMLNVASGTSAGNGASVTSKRRPRYQPNRGHLYSTSVICPNPTGDGRRKWGIYNSDKNGVYFELEGDGVNWALYAVRLSNSVVKTRQPITMPSGFDPSKGHVYDIQYQWRGVGNYKWFIDLQEVYADTHLGTLTELSVQNPTNGATYESITDTTTELELKAGCVDISSEGGNRDYREFDSISTGESLLLTNNVGAAVLAIRVPRTVAATGDDTRILVLSKLATWTRDEAATQVWAGRDVSASNLDGLTWTTMPDGVAEYLTGGLLSSLDTAFQLDKANMRLLLNEWEDTEVKNIIDNPDQENAPFTVTPGDIIVVVVKTIALGVTRETSATMYLSEEI